MTALGAGVMKVLDGCPAYGGGEERVETLLLLWAARPDQKKRRSCRAWSASGDSHMGIYRVNGLR